MAQSMQMNEQQAKLSSSNALRHALFYVTRYATRQLLEDKRSITRQVTKLPSHVTLR